MSGYTVYVFPSAWQEIKNLPGHMRQRVKRAINTLATNPRPSKSKKLDVPDVRNYGGCGWTIGELFMPLPKQS